MSTHQSSKELFGLFRRSKAPKGKNVFWNSRLYFLAWMTLSMVYALAIPSLMNAASGYILPTTAVWKMPDESFTSDPYQAYRACWHIEDGSRIGISDGSVVSGPIQNLFNSSITIFEEKRLNDSTFLYDSGYPDFDELTTCNSPVHIPHDRGLTKPDYLQLHKIYSSARDLASKQFPINLTMTYTERYFIEKQRRSFALSILGNSTTKITFQERSYNLTAPPLDIGDIDPEESDYHIDQCYGDKYS